VNLLPKKKVKIFSPLLVFSLIVFFISLHDGVISYITPVLLNLTYNNTLLAGSILSISSFFGIFFNIFITKYFSKKSYKFFTFWMIIFAFITTLILMLSPRLLLPFIVAMITWSTYYEFRNYSKYNFVEKFLPSQKNAQAWSTMSIFQSMAYMLGPAIAIYLYSRNPNQPFIASMIIISLASLFFIGFQKIYSKKKIEDGSKEEIRSIFDEVKITHILSKRIWPLVVFSFALTLLDVSFWTIGVLFSEQLRSQNQIGGLFVSIYTSAAIITGIVTPRIYGHLGKKRTAFVAGLIAGILLIFLAAINNVYLILIMVFIISLFSGVAFILTYATFEDYVTRLDGNGYNMISIGQISQNVAYVLGPIFFGLVSKDGNLGHSFIAAGEILIFLSIVALAVVPRKIKMPHKEIAKIIEKVIDEI
jgi:MFS family permease